MTGGLDEAGAEKLVIAGGLMRRTSMTATAEATPKAKASPPNIAQAPMFALDAGPGRYPRMSTAAVPIVPCCVSFPARFSH